MPLTPRGPGSRALRTRRKALTLEEWYAKAEELGYSREDLQPRSTIPGQPGAPYGPPLDMKAWEFYKGDSPHTVVLVQVGADVRKIMSPGFVYRQQGIANGREMGAWLARNIPAEALLAMYEGLEQAGYTEEVKAPARAAREAGRKLRLR